MTPPEPEDPLRQRAIVGIPGPLPLPLHFLINEILFLRYSSEAGGVCQPLEAGHTLLSQQEAPLETNHHDSTPCIWEGVMFSWVIP